MKLVTVLAATITALATLPANAAVSGTYYEENISANCSNDYICVVDLPNFPASIAGKFVTITEVGCLMTSASPLTQAYLTASGRRVQPLSVPYRSGAISFRERITFKISASGNGVEVHLLTQSSTTSTYANCTIIGTITPN